jgi:predicted Zn-dependent peptidase
MLLQLKKTLVFTHHLSRSIELLADVVFNSNFPKQELEKEKEVVIDEINSYKDSPSDLIFDEFDQLLFADHTLGNDILGSIKSVKSITKSNVVDFVNKHYQPENIVISSVGNYSLNKLLKILNKAFTLVGNKYETPKRIAPVFKPVVDKEVIKDVYQSHTIIGGKGYGSDSDHKTSLLLLNNLLGGPAMNSRLNLNIREKYGVTYMLESNCSIYSDCGSFSVYFGTDTKHTDKTERLIKKELQKLCDNKLGTLQLSQAKKQVKGQLAISMENSLGVMLSQGKSKLVYEKVDSIDEVLKEFEKITTEKLLEVANEIMDPKHLFKLTYKQE